ncbi:MAG: fused MFS/spermidine synthase, partial [Dehalococcoidia bacterium]|nr:fused MFS/spermidine synthase [Dehalococcoidia bacterium]
MVLATYALGGMIALAYEVVWTRLLATIFPGTVYAFAIMLCAILTGIAVGSWAINRVIVAQRNWLLIYALMQGAIGLTALYSLVVIGQAYRILAWTQALIGNPDPNLIGEPWYMALFALVCIFPCALVMGLLFPVAAKLYGAGRREVAKRVGTIYGANTIGAIVGSLSAGLVLIPLLGAQKTLWALAGANLILSVGVLAVAPAPMRRRLAVTVVGVAVFIGALVLTPDVYQQLFATDPQNQATLWYHEGQDATVKVTVDLEGNRVIYTNSAGQNSDGRAEAVFHYQLGLLGPLLHPDPRQALVVGIGAGQTAGAAALHPGIHVTAVELLDGVVQAQPFFSHVNFDLLNRPNVTIVVNDGRNFLLTTPQKFDVIESDPIWPTHAGAANLYSVDYYRLARSALKDDGIMVQWVDTSLPEHIYKMMVRAFYEVFPNATMWFHGSILVGSPGPLFIDRDAITAKLLQDSEMREVLNDLGLRNGNDVLREFVAGPHEVRQYLGDGPMLTDRFPYVEYARFTPTDGTRADLRWYRVANYVAARERADDAIIFSDGAVEKGFRAFHRSGLATFTPRSVVGEAEAETAARLEELLARHERVWFIPWWNTPTDTFLERWLNARAYQVVNEPLGNLRVLLYVRPGDEPALRQVAVGFGSTLQLARAGSPVSAQVGDVVRLPMEWVAQRDIRENYKVAVRLVDDRGRVYASFDRLPRATPTTGWRAGQTVVDRAGLV